MIFQDPYASINPRMRVRDIVGEVRSSADSLVSASTQIAGGAQDLSQRTHQAGASAQQSAAAMEQVTATVQQTADHAPGLCLGIVIQKPA